MNYLTGIFYVFLIVALAVYYIVPAKYRYVVIFAASIVFYGWGSPKNLLVLLGIAVWTYIGGLAIDKAKGRKMVYLIFFFSTIAILGAFKYTSLTMLVGLSFYVFQSCNYLGDVYRRKIEVERNPICYGAYVAFFPTLLSGPIQKSRKLLPQIKSPAPFTYEEGMKGLLLIGWGICEKLLVANPLGKITEGVYTNYESVTWAHFVIAVLAYSLYIYADFNAYSDMARGVAKLLGIDVGRNFNNPYLSTSLSEFWRRWHSSLNDWFVENVYIPLGGSRKGKLRKYFNMMVIFFVSGLWHGNGINFAVWGVANGILVVIGQILKPARTKLWTSLKVNEDGKIMTFIRRVLVYLFISGTWIFFANGTRPSIAIIKSLLHVDLASFKNTGLLALAGETYQFVFAIIFTLIFVIVQILRSNERGWYEKFKGSPVAVQYLAGGILAYSAIMSACTYLAELSANTAGAQFIYFNF